MRNKGKIGFGILISLLLIPSILIANTWQIKLKNQLIDVEIAESQAEQRMGLGNRFSLPEGSGMLFIYRRPGERIFWMKRMHFPIDIIWLLQNKVVHVERDVQPSDPGARDSSLKRYGHGVYADMVLEVPADYSRKYRIVIGDELEVIHR